MKFFLWRVTALRLARVLTRPHHAASLPISSVSASTASSAGTATAPRHRPAVVGKEEVDEIDESAGPRAPDLHADADPVPVKVVREMVVKPLLVVGVDVHDHGLRLKPLGHL